jgi:hypothetical protein
MCRTSTHRRAVVAGAAIVACSLVALPSAASAAPADQGAVTAPVSAAGGVVKSAHLTLGDCSARNVVMRATMARRSFTASQPVTVTALVSNNGSRPCTFGGSTGPHQVIGPCGSFSMDVFNGHGADIWPGPVAYSCPMIGASTLAPHATLTATGSWPKSSVTRTSNAPAPAGTYRLVIDRTISFSIRLTSPTS